jgi:hypothetical protein
MNVLNIMNLAIEIFAKSGYVHDDLEFRHFGLLPKFDGNKLIELMPILIDLERVSYVGDYDTAVNMMKEKMNGFLGTYTIVNHTDIYEKSNSYKFEDEISNDVHTD